MQCVIARQPRCVAADVHVAHANDAPLRLHLRSLWPSTPRRGVQSRHNASWRGHFNDSQGIAQSQRLLICQLPCTASRPSRRDQARENVINSLVFILVVLVTPSNHMMVALLAPLLGMRQVQSRARNCASACCQSARSQAGTHGVGAKELQSTMRQESILFGVMLTAAAVPAAQCSKAQRPQAGTIRQA